VNALGEALAYGLAAAVLGTVALAVSAVVRRIANARTIAGLPEPAERAEHLSHVRALRRGGATLEECIATLKRCGLRGGVARSLVLDMEREQPADVGNPREGRWRGCRFRYPGNWRLQPLFPGLPDAGITLEGVGSGMFLLVALDDAPASIDELVAEQAKRLREPERVPVETWGRLRGEGTLLRGVQAQVRIPMEVLVFRPAGVPEPFALVEGLADEERELVAPGLALIRESFGLAP